MLQDEIRFEFLQEESELPDAGPSAADYTLPSDFDVHNPKHEKEFIFKGDVTFGKASRMDTFSYLRKCPGADRDIPGPESYRPKTVGQFEVPVKQKVAVAKSDPLYSPSQRTLISRQGRVERFKKPTLHNLTGPGRYGEDDHIKFGINQRISNIRDHESYSFAKQRRDRNPEYGQIISPGPARYSLESHTVDTIAQAAKLQFTRTFSKKQFGGAERFPSDFIDELLKDIEESDRTYQKPPAPRTVKCAFGIAERKDFLSSLQVHGFVPVNVPGPGSYSPSPQAEDRLSHMHTFNVRSGHEIPVPGGKGIASNPEVARQEYHAHLRQQKKRGTRTLDLSSEAHLPLPPSNELHRLFEDFRKPPVFPGIPTKGSSRGGGKTTGDPQASSRAATGNLGSSLSGTKSAPGLQSSES